MNLSLKSKCLSLSENQMKIGAGFREVSEVSRIQRIFPTVNRYCIKIAGDLQNVSASKNNIFSLLLQPPKIWTHNQHVAPIISMLTYFETRIFEF